MSIIDDLPSGKATVAQNAQADRAWLDSQWLDVSRHIETPKWSLMQGDVGFAPLGNIQAIAAPMKSGKTWVMLQLCVGVLKGEFCGLTCPLQDARVLYFDTEQDIYDTMLIARRVHLLMGWDFLTPNDRFKLAPLRTLDAAQRLKAIMLGIQYYQPQVVFVDGIRDLVDDFNDLEQSSALINQFLKTTQDKECAIWSVLHTNPGSDKMRGHLGTELGNKVTDVLGVSKVFTPETHTIHFEVKHLAARHRDLETWKFVIDDNTRYSTPKLITSEIEIPEPTASAKADKEKDLDNLFREALTGSNLSWNDLCDKAMSIAGKSKSTIARRIKDAEDRGIIRWDKSFQKYWYNGLQQQQQEIPFNNEESEVPF